MRMRSDYATDFGLTRAIKIVLQPNAFNFCMYGQHYII